MLIVLELRAPKDASRLSPGRENVLKRPRAAQSRAELNSDPNAEIDTAKTNALDTGGLSSLKKDKPLE